ncbi:hypothetical protein AYK24_06935 [Thermoplasmatales archaeon SG8-52-4]|nr:MAG: hypothetical protein AYK24_06935 [Thermoplasmatales archaeon SG8-52-4]
MDAMILFGLDVPIWLIFLIGILVLIVAWKIIKFAIKVLLIAVVIFIIIMGLDFINFFSWIQNIF